MQTNKTTTAGTYECPAGEERLWHLLMSPAKRFDPKTGEEKYKAQVHKVGQKTFKNLYNTWLLQGYEITILHDPGKWEKEQAAKVAAAAQRKEAAVKGTDSKAKK